MQKAILYIIIGALIASVVWGYAYRRADLTAAESLDSVRTERDEAIERAEGIESELDGALSRIGELEETNDRIKTLLDGISDASTKLDHGLRGYGRINRDFAEFIERYGAKE